MRVPVSTLDDGHSHLHSLVDLGGSIADYLLETASDSDDPFGPTTTKINLFHQGADNQSSRGRATPPVPPGLEGLGQAPYQRPSGTVGPSNSEKVAIKPAVPAFLAKHAITDGNLADSRKSSLASLLSRPTTPSLSQIIAQQQKDREALSGSKSPVRDQAKAKSVTAAAVPAESARQKRSTPTVEPSEAGKDAEKASHEEPESEPATASTKAPAKAEVASKSNSKPSSIETPVKSAPIKGEVHQKAAPSPAATKTKRRHPGKLDIDSTSQTQSALPTSSSSQIAAKPPASEAASMSSRPGTPSARPETAPPRRAHTIRLVSTPQVDKAPVLTTPLAAAVAKIPSRNPSVASGNPPGTPSSEHISDTVSPTSNSISRPTSPPLGTRVGSAPVRNKTKSQIKKDRQERAKVIEEEQKASQPDPPAQEETVQEAIIGRKKKAKKPSAAPAPKSKPPKVEEPEPASATPVEPSPEPKAPASEVEPEPPKSEVKAQSEPKTNSVEDFWISLRTKSPLAASSLEQMLRPYSPLNYRYSQEVQASDFDLDRPFERDPIPPSFPDELIKAIKAGELFRYGGRDNRIWSQGCVTPGGAHLRYLEAELEERYGQLERDHKKIPYSMRYHTDKTRLWQDLNVYDELPTVDLDALRVEADRGRVASARREPNAMERAVEEGSKKGSFLVGNADVYVDEFVMPVVRRTDRVAEEEARRAAGINDRLELPQLEKTMNAAGKMLMYRQKELCKLIYRNRRILGIDK